MSGAIPRMGESVAIAAPAVEQNGQKCALVPPVLRSAQKWNCASRNTTASNMAIHALFVVILIPIGTVGPKSYLMSTREGTRVLLQIRVLPTPSPGLPNASLRVRGYLGLPI